MRFPVTAALALTACVRPADLAHLPPALRHGEPPRAARECPDAPLVELHTSVGESLGESLGAGGHILTLTLARPSDDDSPVALVGTLDVKGTLALERGTRALALANYAAAQRGEAVGALAVTLRGRTLATMALASALRGSRFRIPLRATSPNDDLDARTEADLAAALEVDRRCFPGR